MTERFTVYDIFAVLVPGAIFDLLLALTLRHATGFRVFDWRGGFGDATVLIVVGYATGVLLQALGKAATHFKIFPEHMKTSATVRLIASDSKDISAELRRDFLDALQEHYGPLPADKDDTYKQRLKEMAYRAYKALEPDDPLVRRHLAEHHQMRAYFVSFTLLAMLGLACIASRERSMWFYAAVVGAYAAMSALACWRMADKDVDLGRHIIFGFLKMKHQPTS